MEREIRVVFVHSNGRKECHLGRDGESVMDVALDNGVPGILAQCGGGCTCSTCHCYVDQSWYAKCGEMHPDEVDILSFTPNRRSNSRLSCQISLTRPLDGICIYTIDESDKE